MTTKKNQLVNLISAIVLASLGLVCMIVACIFALNSSDMAYIHDIKIKDIETQHATEEGTVFYIVTIDGNIYNNTDKNYDVVNLEIIFDGIENKSGEETEFLSSIIIENLHADGKTNINAKKLKVGNQRGFIPESIKSISIVSAEDSVEVPYGEVQEGSLMLFSSAIVLLFVSALVFAKWNNKRKEIIVEK